MGRNRGPSVRRWSGTRAVEGKCTDPFEPSSWWVVYPPNSLGALELDPQTIGSSTLQTPERVNTHGQGPTPNPPPGRPSSALRNAGLSSVSMPALTPSRCRQRSSPLLMALGLKRLTDRRCHRRTSRSGSKPRSARSIASWRPWKKRRKKTLSPPTAIGFRSLTNIFLPDSLPPLRNVRRSAPAVRAEGQGCHISFQRIQLHLMLLQAHPHVLRRRWDPGTERLPDGSEAVQRRTSHPSRPERGPS